MRLKPEIAIFRDHSPHVTSPTSYLYDPNGEIVMFIPGQVKLQNIHAFVSAWNRKNLGVAADRPAASADVKEVDFSKPKPATPPQRTSKPTT